MAKPEPADHDFGSYGRTGHLIDRKASWLRIRSTGKLPDLRMYDLRRTLASWQAITGTSLHVIGKSLGHRDPSATMIYARLTQEPVNESVDKAALAMLTAGGILESPTEQGVEAGAFHATN
jgi:integrase